MDDLLACVFYLIYWIEIYRTNSQQNNHVFSDIAGSAKL